MVQTPLPSTSVSPITYKEKNVQEELSININEINKCLDQMDTEETRRRRFEYNLLVKVCRDSSSIFSWLMKLVL